MKSFAKNSIFNLLYRLTSLIFPLITSVYVSRILLPEGVGQVAYAQNITSYFLVLASLGLPAYGVREIAKSNTNQELLDKTFTELLIVNLIFTILSSGVFLFIISQIIESPLDLKLFLACGIQIFLNFINIDWFYQGMEEYMYIAYRSILIKLLSIVAIFIFVHTRSDFILYALISSLAAVGNYVFNIFHARKFVSLHFRNLSLKRHVRPNIIFALIIFLGTIYNKIDVTMLGLFTSEQSVGLYTIAHRMIDIIISTCAAITATLLPRLSYYYQNDKDLFSDSLKIGLKVLDFLVLPMSIGIVFIAPQLIELLFGVAFLPVVATIRIFSFIIVIRVYGDLLCYQLLIASGNENKRIAANLIATIINIILNIILIPRFSYNGAAIASVISELTVNIYIFIVIKKQLNFSFTLSSFWQALLSSLVMLLGFLPSTLIKAPLLFEVILSIVSCATIYLIINVLSKNELLNSLLKKMDCRQHCNFRHFW
jgi:O-antigen/teichoic acid export membrane protein